MKAFTLGRSPEVSCDVGANFPRVSRRHAEISYIGSGRYRIRDLNTPNGTEILKNGRWVRVSEATISNSQRFRLAGQFESSVEELAWLGHQIARPQARASGLGEPRMAPPRRFRTTAVLMTLTVVGLSLGGAYLWPGRDSGHCGGSVKVYFKEGCPYCEATEAFLLSLHVRYQRINIASPGVLERLEKEYGSVRGVPLVVIDGVHWEGHNEMRLRKALCRA
jgi:glutaredoxin